MPQFVARLMAAGVLIAAASCLSPDTDGATAPIAVSSSSAHAALDPGSGELILSDLNNPRGMTFGPEGALYVAEAGRGRGTATTGPCFIQILGTQPPQTMCYGPTGSITRWWHGQHERVITGLPSYAQINSGRAEGPNGISMNGLGGAYVSIGLEADPRIRETAPEFARFARLVQLSPPALSPGHGNGPSAATWEFIADIGEYEMDHNPDCGEFNSNPFGVFADAGSVIVTDAGGNYFLRRDANGDLSTMATFSNSTTKPGPGCPPAVASDFVPTTITRGPDGAYYMGHLNGLPIVKGAASIWRMEQGGTPQVYLSGFTWILSIAFDPSGNLYVLQHSDSTSTSTPGSLIRVTPAGVRDTVVKKIVRPGGMAIDSDGAVYISMIPGSLNYRLSAGEVRRYTP